MIVPAMTRLMAVPVCVLLLVAAMESEAEGPSKVPANPFIKVQKVRNPAAASAGADQENLDEAEHRLVPPLRGTSRSYHVRRDEERGGATFGNGVRGRTPADSARGTHTGFRRGGGTKGKVPGQAVYNGLLPHLPSGQVPVPWAEGQGGKQTDDKDSGDDDLTDDGSAQK